MRALIVSNGHGEDAIGLRIARELRLRDIETELFPLVGTGPEQAPFAGNGEQTPCVGPRRAMPSGGIVAFGNLGNIARDVRAGLLGLLAEQLRFLRASRGRYDAAVAVGDTFCLAMARASGLPAFFVGTAKSVRVAPYGALERRVMRGAAGIFVRDEATAVYLRAHGIEAQAPGNVMMDMLEGGAPPGLQAPWLALLPGSRECAYEDARFLVRIARGIAAERSLPVLLSIPGTLDRNRMASLLIQEGWIVGARESFALEARAGAAYLYGWRGRIGSILRGAMLALGQAGTANEQAAGAGVPVVAFEPGGAHRTGWYRMRQQRLLGEALLVVEKDERRARDAVARLLDDAPRRERMGAIGRASMGRPGGASAIADAVASLIGAG